MDIKVLIIESRFAIQYFINFFFVEFGEVRPVELGPQEVDFLFLREGEFRRGASEFPNLVSTEEAKVVRWGKGLVQAHSRSRPQSPSASQGKACELLCPP